MPSPEIVARLLRGEELPLAVDRLATELAGLWQAVPGESKLAR